MVESAPVWMRQTFSSQIKQVRLEYEPWDWHLHLISRDKDPEYACDDYLCDEHSVWTKSKKEKSA